MDNISNALLEKLKASRTKLEDYSNEVETLRDDVLNLFPKQMDYRKKWVFEERIKTTSQFYDSLLRVRQEINKSIKEEIELRRKLNEKEFDPKKAIENSIRDIVDEIEKRNEEKEDDNDKNTEKDT
jgi:hypothetical protein